MKMSQLSISDVEWKEDDLLIEIEDENVTVPQTQVAASTPVQAPTVDEMLSPLESPIKKKPCFWELTVAHLLKTAPPLCLEPNYNDAELVGYTWPLLTDVILLIKYKAQNMMESTFRQELQCIREVDHLQYIIAIKVWFRQWRQEHGYWPSLPACGFQVGALATATIETQVVSVTSEIKMTLGERQVLWVLMTLQYLAEVGLMSLPPRHVTQCTVYHAASAAGRDLIYASCCTRICHINSLKKCLSQN